MQVVHSHVVLLPFMLLSFCQTPFSLRRRHERGPHTAHGKQKARRERLCSGRAEISFVTRVPPELEAAHAFHTRSSHFERHENERTNGIITIYRR